MFRPKIGDLAQAVNMNGDFILPEPLRVEDVFEHQGITWARFEGQLSCIEYAAVVWP